MEPKKTVKADLEWRKSTFFQVGLFVSLLAVFLAFEYVGAREKTEIFTGEGAGFIDDDQMLQTEQPKEVPPPPPAETVSTVIEIVQNTAEVSDFTIDADATQDDKFAEQTYNVEDTKEVAKEEAIIFQVVEEQPEFPGGEEKRLQFLRDNVQYPRAAKEMGLEGRVTVGFVVEPDGSISNVKILRGVAPSLDEEAIRVAKLMPKWKAGKQRGKAVRAQYNMPITFVLSN